MLSITHQDLFQHVITQKITITAAAITYLPDRLLHHTTLNKQECCKHFCQNKPYALALLETELGNILNIAIPIFESDLFIDQANTVQEIEAAILKANEFNVKTITLTGLLPSVSSAPYKLFENSQKLLPRITAGHDSSFITIFFNLEYCLEITKRNISQETIGFLGMGSIGTNILKILIQHYEHPKRIILCDLYQNKTKLDLFAKLLKDKYQYFGDVLITNSGDQVPTEFYEATTIIGASNVPNIIDITQLRSGTLIIDDSTPPVLSVSDAITRFESQHDVLYIEAGLIKSPYLIQQTISLPKGLEVPLFKNDAESCFEIAGCILLGLVSHLETNENTFKENYSYLQQLGYRAPRLQFHGYFYEDTSYLDSLISACSD